MAVWRLITSTYANQQALTYVIALDEDVPVCVYKCCCYLGIPGAAGALIRCRKRPHAERQQLDGCGQHGRASQHGRAFPDKSRAAPRVYVNALCTVFKTHPSQKDLPHVQPTCAHLGFRDSRHLHCSHSKFARLTCAGHRPPELLLLPCLISSPPPSPPTSLLHSSCTAPPAGPTTPGL